MNKSELTDIVYSDDVCGKDIQSRAAAERIVNAVFDTIKASISNGEDVRIDKFGTFSVVRRSAKEGTNPNTHEKIMIESKKAIKFSPASEFKKIAETSDAAV